MTRKPSATAAAEEDRQASLNAAQWARGDFVDLYASRRLRPVEAVLLDRYRQAFSGRVLELGCGAGRLTGHLSEVAREVHGVDLSPAMVAYCERAYPRASFSVGDLRELSGFADGGYDVVVAPFNVLDVLGDEARRQVLADARRLLAEGGLFVMSSHNRDYASRLASRLRLWARLWVGSPRRPLASIASLPRRFGNRRRLRALQRVEERYAVLNDEAHDFSVLHYYVSRDAQEQQMAAAGYAFLECLDLDGRSVNPRETASHCSELHYVAGR
jgi:SAM-dependent methyltransferase